MTCLKGCQRQGLLRRGCRRRGRQLQALAREDHEADGRLLLVPPPAQRPLQSSCTTAGST